MLTISPKHYFVNAIAALGSEAIAGSGTGTSKGITYLAHDFHIVPERHGHYWEYLESDVVLATSKKYFTHGIWPGVLIPRYWGATAVLIRQPAQPAAVLDVLRRHRVTKLITVPTVIKNLLEYVSAKQEKPSLPNLKLVISASEKNTPRDLRAHSVGLWR